MTITTIIILAILAIGLITALCMASAEQQEQQIDRAYIEYARRKAMWEDLEKRINNMKGHPAGAAAMRTFKNTANRGSYKNSPKIQPRGGTSFK